MRIERRRARRPSRSSSVGAGLVGDLRRGRSSARRRRLRRAAPRRRRPPRSTTCRSRVGCRRRRRRGRRPSTDSYALRRRSRVFGSSQRTRTWATRPVASGSQPHHVERGHRVARARPRRRPPVVAEVVVGERPVLVPDQPVRRRQSTGRTTTCALASSARTARVAGSLRTNSVPGLRLLGDVDDEPVALVGQLAPSACRRSRCPRRRPAARSPCPPPRGSWRSMRSPRRLSPVLARPSESRMTRLLSPLPEAVAGHLVAR